MEYDTNFSQNIIYIAAGKRKMVHFTFRDEALKRQLTEIHKLLVRQSLKLFSLGCELIGDMSGRQYCGRPVPVYGALPRHCPAQSHRIAVR